MHLLNVYTMSESRQSALYSGLIIKQMNINNINKLVYSDNGFK